MSPGLHGCPRLHSGPVRILLPRFRERRKQARLWSTLAAAASVSQETTSKTASSKRSKGLCRSKLTTYIQEEIVEPDSPWAHVAAVAVEGLKEDELLFRFGDTEGWDQVAEPLGSVSYTQAWQCRRKSSIIADHPDKAADISFAFPLWGPDAATPSDEDLQDAHQSLEAIEAIVTNGTSTSSGNNGGSSPPSSDSHDSSSSPSSKKGSPKGPSPPQGKLTKAQKKAKLAAEKLEQAKAKHRASQKAASAATKSSAALAKAAAGDLQASLEGSVGTSPVGAAEPSGDSPGGSETSPWEAGLTKKERQRRRKALANAAKSPPEPAAPAAASVSTGAEDLADLEGEEPEIPPELDDYFNDTGVTIEATPSPTLRSQQEAVDSPADGIYFTSPIVPETSGSNPAASSSEPAASTPDPTGTGSLPVGSADAQDPAFSSTARDATAEASTSGRETSGVGSTEDSKPAATVLKATDTVSAAAYLDGLTASVPPSGQLVYQDGWLTRADDFSTDGNPAAKSAPASQSKGFSTPKDPPKAASKELPKHLQEVPLASRQGKTSSPSSGNGAAQEQNGAAQAADSKRPDASRLEADPAVSLAQIKQVAAAPVENQAGLLQQAVAAATGAETQEIVTSDEPLKPVKRGPLWRLRRRFRRAWKTMVFPVQWALEAAWLKVRYQTLRALYTLLQPGPPAFHASPRIAQLLAIVKTTGFEDAVHASKDLGWDEDGKHEDPLSDLPRWRLEALIGGPVRNMNLFRQALTAPAALPEGQELASYERLEFLGDAVLELAIREHLFTRFDMVDEGQLTLISQMYLTNNAALCSIARRMHLDRYMATSLRKHFRSSTSGTWTDDPTLSDLLESLIGALYRDQGLVACKRFVRRQIIDTTKLDPQVQPRLSRKSSLISFVNTRSLGHIAFKTKLSRKVLSNGILTSTWVTEVRLNGRFLAKAEGTRKVVDSLAAKAALLQLQSEEDDSQADEAK